MAIGAISATTGALADEPSTLTFAEPTSITVARSEGGTTLTVLRSGDTSQAATATVTGSEGFEGRVTVAAGASSATISVPLPERGAIAPGGFVTFTLSDPSPGSVIGPASTVSMSIYEDEPDPTPPPPNRPPSTTIERTGAARITGRASDPEAGLARVTLSLRKREGKKCRAVKANGRLSRRGSCSARYSLVATGTTRWALRLAHRLPAGTYVVKARALDLGGLADGSPATRTFTVR